MKPLTETRNSVAFHLLKAVFLLYFIFTATLTAAHMVLEYQNTKVAILRELDLVQQAFADNLSLALYDLSESQLHAIVTGMVTLPAVSGVQIRTTGLTYAFSEALGTVINNDGSQVSIANDTATPNNEALFWIEFPVYQRSTEIVLGTGRIYSSSSVIYQQVSGIFAIILGGAILKTSALWLLFLWAARSRLNRPITVLTSVMDGIDFESADPLKISVATGDNKGRVGIDFDLAGKHTEHIEVHAHDEIHRLTLSFDRMNQAILHKIHSLKLLGGLAESLIRKPLAGSAFAEVVQVVMQAYSMTQALVFTGGRTEPVLLTHRFAADASPSAPLPAQTPLSQQTVDALVAVRGPTVLHGIDAAALAADTAASDLRQALALPLMDAEIWQGCIIFFCPDPHFELGPDDRVFLGAVARLTVIALKNIHMLELIDAHTRNLESQIDERTGDLRVAKEYAEETLQRLQETQVQLIQQGKMAALGGLVAGVAHEINTPVGNAMTTASFVLERTRSFTNDLLAGQRLSRSALQEFLDDVREAGRIVFTNIERAAELVASFKRVASDQTSEERRVFILKPYVQQILRSLGPRLNESGHQVELLIPDTLEIDSLPGAIGQIITNLTLHSLAHHFPDGLRGTISISASTREHSVLISYSDNGCGIDSAHVERIFEPYFTAIRSEGEGGLGMHIVYSLVTRALGGSIQCHSEPGQGIRFDICLPAVFPDDTAQQSA